MNLSKQILLCASALCLAASLSAQPAPQENAPENAASATAAPTTKQNLTAKRGGDKVTLSWTLPEGSWSRIEVIRNGRESNKGRARIKILKGDATEYTYTIPDGTKPYWYWVKLTGKDKKVTNLGPAKVE